MSDETEGPAGEPRDEASPGDCVIEEESEESETEFHPFSELDEDFKPGPAVRIMGEDGLPVTVDQTATSDIPALSTESLICMGDFSKFVIRDEWGDVVAEFSPSFVSRAPSGQWRVPTDVAIAEPAIVTWRERIQTEETSTPWTTLMLMRHLLGVRGLTADSTWTEVEPLRPPCRNYVQQKTVFHLNAENRLFPRLCSARRTTEGTFMTVRDSGMWACTMREPRDIESEKALEAFDLLKIEQGKNRQHLPMFGGGAGIFDSNAERK